MTEAVELLRWANVVLAGVAVAVLVAGTMLRAERLTPRERRVRPWVVVVFGVIAYGSGEAAAQDSEGGLRVVFMTLALSGFLVAALYRFHDVDGQ